jgi:hypothetical protein
LPRTNKIVFCREEQGFAAIGTWDRVQQIVGHLMTPMDDLYPPRFYVDEFPSDEQLRAIGNERL